MFAAGPAKPLQPSSAANKQQSVQAAAPLKTVKAAAPKAAVPGEALGRHALKPSGNLFYVAQNACHVPFDDSPTCPSEWWFVAETKVSTPAAAVSRPAVQPVPPKPTSAKRPAAIASVSAHTPSAARTGKVTP